MKLSSRDIAIIEDLLTQREQGNTNAEIAKSCGLTKDYDANAVAQAFCFLKRAGVNVPETITRGEQLKRELAEFRAWKAAQARKTESTLIPRGADPSTVWTNGAATLSGGTYPDAVRVTGL